MTEQGQAKEQWHEEVSGRLWRMVNDEPVFLTAVKANATEHALATARELEKGLREWDSAGTWGSRYHWKLLVQPHLDALKQIETTP